MPHVHSNISITAKLGVINSQFYRNLRLCSCKEFFVSQMISLIVLLVKPSVKCYPLKILLKRTRGLLNKKIFFLEFLHLEYSKWFCIESCTWGGSCKRTWSLFFPAVLFCVFCLSCRVFLFFVISLCCCLLLASSMAEFSCCFWICSRNLVCRLVFSLAFTHCKELMKSVGKLW
jgi:general stress protein CsbA